MNEITIQFSIYPPKTLLERLKRVAKNHHRSANSEILMLIEEHVTREEKKLKHAAPQSS